MSSATKVGLFKTAWHTLPEIVGSSIMGAIGICLGGFGVYNYYAKDGDNRRYKLDYTVIRHDDPRAAKVRKD